MSDDTPVRLKIQDFGLRKGTRPFENLKTYMMKTLIFTVIMLMTVSFWGQPSNSKKNYSKQIELPLAVEDVWHLISDVSLWKEWDGHIVDARFNGAFTKKAKGSLVTSYSKVVDFQIVEFISGESYTIRHELSSGALYKRRTVKPSEIGVKVTTEVWFKGLSLNNFKKYMGDDYSVLLEVELESLKRIAQN